MEKISKPSINRIARRAGVKSVSEDCFDTIRNLIGMELNTIIKTVLIVNQTKTVMVKDVYDALHLLNYNTAQSTELNTGSSHK